MGLPNARHYDNFELQTLRGNIKPLKGKMICRSRKGKEAKKASLEYHPKSRIYGRKTSPRPRRTWKNYRINARLYAKVMGWCRTRLRANLLPSRRRL